MTSQISLHGVKHIGTDHGLLCVKFYGSREMVSQVQELGIVSSIGGGCYMLIVDPNRWSYTHHGGGLVFTRIESYVTSDESGGGFTESFE